MTVHAYAALAAREAFSSFEYEPPDLQPHEVEVAITNCGICHSDIHLIDNDWGFSSYPLVPGHEIIGNVNAAIQKVRSNRVRYRMVLQV
jgi:uncharacterized zinc-type alcohol dehydrogenase-like protein